MKDNPVGRDANLPVQVARRISGQILDGRLKPGDRLPTEQELAAIFDVSRNVVREAIARLRAEGIVRSRQGAGVFVVEMRAQPSLRLDAEELQGRQEIQMLFELRGVLEIAAAGFAAERRTEEGLTAPAFWARDADGTWWRRRFGVVEPVPLDQPVVHVCAHEADAYAAWAGARLPTEAEWEKAARHDPATGTSRRYPWGDADPTPAHANLGQRHLSAAPVGAYPAGASPLGVEQLMGDVWEWTASGWHPYPGFTAFPYREYSEVFFGGDYRVLRGGSFGTDAAAVRGTFRNWDHPVRRQIFAGFRLAWDA